MMNFWSQLGNLWPVFQSRDWGTLNPVLSGLKMRQVFRILGLQSLATILPIYHGGLACKLLGSAV